MFLQRWIQPKQPNNLVGLDIDSGVIKILRINTSKHPHVVENFAIFPLPVGAIVKNEIKDPALCANILKDALRQADLGSCSVAFAIPRSLAIIKNVMVDSRLNESEIESRAWIEADRNFPDLIGDIYLDYNVLGVSAQDPTQLELILVACRKEQLNAYLDLLRNSNLTPKIVDVNCYALERSLSLMASAYPASGAIALLNLNFTLSTLIVVHESQLIYAHDHSYDGQRMMMQIRKFCNLEGNLIDPIPSTPAQVDNTAYTDILKENLSSHLRHTMHFFYSSRSNISINKLILAGDCATIPNIVSFIQQEVNIETQLANPFVDMKMTSQIEEETLKIYAPTLMLCCGLAISQSE